MTDLATDLAAVRRMAERPDPAQQVRGAVVSASPLMVTVPSSRTPVHADRLAHVSVQPGPALIWCRGRADFIVTGMIAQGA